MNQSHVIDSWIAELGLSGRRVKRDEEAALGATDPVRPGPAALPPRPSHALSPRYQVISSPC
jgi:hypothetical protein